MNDIDEKLGAHRRAWDLIPWVVNGRASAGERTEVEAHVRECHDCRDEFEFQRSVERSLATEAGVTPDPAPSLARLWRRIDREEEAAPAPSARFSRVVRWLAVAVVVEALGLSAIGAQQWLNRNDASYRTLTAVSAAPRATVRVVFSDDLALSDLQALLDRTQLQIVSGPSEAGVLSLAPRDAAAANPQATQAALNVLRANRAVRFAEPVQASVATP